MIKIKDHLGNEYRSINALCDAYGLTTNTFKSRMQRGLTLEQALTMGSRKCSKNKYEYNDEVFSSLAALCDAYAKTSYKNVYNKLKCGWTLEQALNDLPNFRKSDENGEIIKSIYKYAIAHGVPKSGLQAVYYRIRKGMSPADAIKDYKLKSEHDKNKKVDMNINGVHVTTVKAAAHAAGKNYYTVLRRLNHGKSLHDALTFKNYER